MFDWMHATIKTMIVEINEMLVTYSLAYFGIVGGYSIRNCNKSILSFLFVKLLKNCSQKTNCYWQDAVNTICLLWVVRMKYVVKKWLSLLSLYCIIPHIVYHSVMSHRFWQDNVNFFIMARNQQSRFIWWIGMNILNMNSIR